MAACITSIIWRHDASDKVFAPYSEAKGAKAALSAPSEGQDQAAIVALEGKYMKPRLVSCALPDVVGRETPVQSPSDKAR